MKRSYVDAERYFDIFGACTLAYGDDMIVKWQRLLDRKKFILSFKGAWLLSLMDCDVMMLIRVCDPPDS